MTLKFEPNTLTGRHTVLTRPALRPLVLVLKGLLQWADLKQRLKLLNPSLFAGHRASGAAAAGAGASGAAGGAASLEELYVTRLPFCGIGHRVSRAAAAGAGAEGPAAGGGPQ